MVERRSIINIREAQLLWIAVIILGTFINFLAMSLLTYYEESVSVGLPNFGTPIFRPPQRKLSHVVSMKSEPLLEVSMERHGSKSSLKAVRNDNAPNSSTSEDNRKSTPTRPSPKRKPPNSSAKESENINQKNITNDHSQVKTLAQSNAQPKRQLPKTTKNARNDNNGLKSIAYYLELSSKEGHDKERILHLLRDNAKINHIYLETYDALPTWTQVTSMYGTQPQIVGTEQCQIFRSQGDLADKFLGVAGAMNTGTNLLGNILPRNCALYKKQEKYGKSKLGIRAQVPWGKHVPPKDAEFRANKIALHNSEGVDPTTVLPVVMTRDPFRWLNSMCLNQYSSRWPRVYRPTDPRYHCPNLYPTEAEKQKLLETGFQPILNGTEIVKETPGVKLDEGIFVDPQRWKDRNKPQALDPVAFTTTEPNTILTQEELRMHHFPLKIAYSNFTHHHYSLVHLWNEFIQSYRQQKDFPHIFIRFEDLLYFPDEVITQVCECAGGRLYRRNETTGEALPVTIPSQSQKQNHQSRLAAKGKTQHTGYLDALIRYADPSTRFRGMTPHDLQYAQEYLDKDLMDLFHYSFPPPPGEVQSDV